MQLRQSVWIGALLLVGALGGCRSGRDATAPSDISVQLVEVTADDDRLLYQLRSGPYTYSLELLLGERGRERISLWRLGQPPLVTVQRTAGHRVRIDSASNLHRYEHAGPIRVTPDEIGRLLPTEWALLDRRFLLALPVPEGARALAPWKATLDLVRAFDLDQSTELMSRRPTALGRDCGAPGSACEPGTPRTAQSTSSPSSCTASRCDPTTRLCRDIPCPCGECDPDQVPKPQPGSELLSGRWLRADLAETTRVTITIAPR